MGWLEDYKNWVKNHSSFIHFAEDALYCITWLVPERFEGSETALEVFQSLCGIVYLWHSEVVKGSADAGLSWAMVLGSIRQVEVLFEMRANRLHDLGKWNKYGPISVLEMVKCMLRAALFRSSDARLVLDSSSSKDVEKTEDRAHAVLSAFERLRDRKVLLPAGLPSRASWQTGLSSSGKDRALARVSEETDRQSHELSLSGDGVGPRTSPRGAPNAYWWDLEAESDEDTPHPVYDGPNCITPSLIFRQELQYGLGQKMFLAGEVLNIARPVFYVLALGRFGHRAWRAWFLSLGVDLLSQLLIARGASTMRNSGLPMPAPSSIQSGIMSFLLKVCNFDYMPSEEEELARRKRLLLFYLLRSPCFETFTRKVMSALLDVLKPIPGVNTLSSKAAEILHGVQKYYYYTSAS